MMKRLTLGILCLILPAISLFGQIQFEAVGLPLKTDFDGIGECDIAFSDIDLDGDEDVMFIGDTGEDRIAKMYKNDGQGNFTEITGTPFRPVAEGALIFFDADGDLIDDLLIIGSDADGPMARLYLNDGRGVFSEKMAVNLPNVFSGDVAHADIDGDMDQDLIIVGLLDMGAAGLSPTTNLFKNDGNGNFEEVMQGELEPLFRGSADFEDVDGDRDMDLFLTGFNDREEVAVLYLNDGNGVFGQKTRLPFKQVVDGDVAFEDIDGDRDKDLVISGDLQFRQLVTKIYRNEGNGNFTEVENTNLPGVRFPSIALKDVEGDGDKDLFITGENTAGIPIMQLFKNNGLGSFHPVSGTPMPGVFNGAIGFSDVEGDGDLDFILAGFLDKEFFSTADLYLNNGKGDFGLGGGPFKPVDQGDMAFGDLNGDGTLDLLITGAGGLGENLVAEIYTNDGVRDFTRLTDTPFKGIDLSDVAIADVNQDMLLDVLLAGRREEAGLTRLFGNNGDCSFSEMLSLFEDVAAGDIAFADVDGDGDQDLMLTGLEGNLFFGTTVLYLNDEGNGFTQSSNVFPNFSSSSIAFADIDGDDDLDLVIAGQSGLGASCKLFENMGGLGMYTEMTDVSLVGLRDGAVAFADVDGDKDMDLLLTGLRDDLNLNTILYTNDGFGDFSEKQQANLPGLQNSAIAFEDVDLDGDNDLLLTGSQASGSGFYTGLYENDGFGNFEIVAEMPFSAISRGAVAFADVDDDQDPDLVLAGQSPEGRIAQLYKNTTQTGVNIADNRYEITNAVGQNHPNPANDKTSIPVKLEYGTEVQMQVYDLNGKEITKPMVTFLPAGRHQIELDTHLFVPGMYLYQVKIGPTCSSKRMLVMR